jgi:RHH-type proline utilization regulon transcriptional repressor/proline dehydrogenase/delta 1-pyrroline-5-carboxylate dehydrogenase
MVDSMINLDPKWDINKRRCEAELLSELIKTAGLSVEQRQLIVAHAISLVEKIREKSESSLLDIFLTEYGLSTDEGVALMCLAEALLRVPDAMTIDALIEDKIAPSDWSKHIGQSSSPLVNASTWGLMLTGKVLGSDTAGVTSTLRKLVKKFGEPVVRKVVAQAMREMGRQFVLDEGIESAMKQATQKESDGFTYSYDMLGEAAVTRHDARRYQQAYSHAISVIAQGCHSRNIADNPSISVKLSALHPRYEVSKAERVMNELLPSLLVLARQAAANHIGLVLPRYNGLHIKRGLMIEFTFFSPIVEPFNIIKNI